MIEVTEALRKFARLNEPESLFGKPARSGLGGKTKHVQNVVRLGLLLLKDKDYLNPELLQIALQLHDIGRSVQWAVCNNFSDREINHRYIALQMIEQFVRTEQCEITADWRVVTEVMQYHGAPYMYGFAHDFALPYIQLV